jgi:hypothetical protein
MADLDIQKIKGNVGKMLAQNAPEADIDAYLKSEGASAEMLRAAPKATAAAVKPDDKYTAAAKQEFADLKARGVPIEQGASRLMLQGATLNAADEVLAGLRTPIEMARRGTWNPVEGYNYAKAQEDVALEDARKRLGWGGTAAEMAGGFVMAPGARQLASAVRAAPGIGQRVATGVGAGAGYGAAAGFMEGSGLQDRAERGAMGAGIGAGVGGAMPVVGAIARPIIDKGTAAARAAINPQGFADSQIARAVGESGQNARTITEALDAAARDRQGVYNVADAMGNAGQRMLSTVARSPGDGRTAIVNALEGRQADQGRRVSSALSDVYGAPQTAAQTRTAMTGARDDAADVAFNAVRADAGPVDLSRTIARIDETLRPGVNAIARPQSGIADDSIESALASVRARLTDGRSVLSEFQAIQRVRADLADKIEAARRAGQNNKVRLLTQVRQELDAAMNAASPGHRAANRAFSEASREIDAIDTGRQAATRGRVEDTVPAFQAMTPRQQQAHRVGYADPLIEQVQGAAVGVNKARPFTSDAARTEAHYFAAPRQGPRFERRIDRENTMFETRHHALGGSRTADNLNDEAALKLNPEIISNLLSGNWLAAGRNAMGQAANAATGMSPTVRRRIAEVLLSTSRDSPEIEQIVRRALANQESRRRLVEALSAGTRRDVALGAQERR